MSAMLIGVCVCVCVCGAHSIFKTILTLCIRVVTLAPVQSVNKMV